MARTERKPAAAMAERRTELLGEEEEPPGEAAAGGGWGGRCGRVSDLLGGREEVGEGDGVGRCRRRRDGEDVGLGWWGLVAGKLVGWGLGCGGLGCGGVDFEERFHAADALVDGVEVVL